MDTVVYAGRLYYESERIHAAAAYCSDGRLGEHFDDFLQNGLHLPRYDRVALPGGPAVLLDSAASRPGSSDAWDALAFLVDVHGLNRVLLLAHEGCAYYSQQLGVGDDAMEAIQRRDLVHVASRIRTLAPHLQVDGYFAHIRGNRILFEQVRMGASAAAIAGCGE